jgi:hypothetical protein
MKLPEQLKQENALLASIMADEWRRRLPNLEPPPDDRLIYLVDISTPALGIFALIRAAQKLKKQGHMSSDAVLRYACSVAKHELNFQTFDGNGQKIERKHRDA